jgi:hypothetical protein
MIMFARSTPKTSHRKLRLFAVACCRRIEHLLNDETVEKALDAAERYADKRIKDDAILKWSKKVAKARDATVNTNGFSPESLARHAVAYATVPKLYIGYLQVHKEVAKTIATESGHQRGSSSWENAVSKELSDLSDLLREVVGNPFLTTTIDPDWLVWNDGTIPRMARGIYDDRAFDRLPFLADALEEAGVTDLNLLAHCRSRGVHVKGCWAIDLMLGKS